MTKIVKGENLKENIIFLPKNNRYFVITDDDGSIKGYFPIKKNNLGKDWVALYQQAISTIADMNLPNEQYRVFLKLLSKVDFENYLCVSQHEISQELNMKQPHVARAIKGLKEKNIIVEGPRAGLNKTYQLNPYVAYKGKNRKETILDFESVFTHNGKSIFDADIRRD